MKEGVLFIFLKGKGSVCNEDVLSLEYCLIGVDDDLVLFSKM